MITPTIIHRYAIATYWSVTCEFISLFSGDEHDGSLMADDMAFTLNAKYWDSTYAIGANGKVTVQLIVFRNKNGMDKYKYDEVVLFDDPEN